MSPTSYQAAPPRIHLCRLITKLVGVIVIVTTAKTLLYKIGSGGQIRTDDLRVMSPTSYQAAPPRIHLCRLITKLVGVIVIVTTAKTLLYKIGSGGQIRTDDLRVMSPTSYQAAPPRIHSCRLITKLVGVIVIGTTVKTLLYKIGSGGQIRTDDLRVMSPTSYQAAPPRINEVRILWTIMLKVNNKFLFY